MKDFNKVLLLFLSIVLLLGAIAVMVFINPTYTASTPEPDVFYCGTTSLNDGENGMEHPVGEQLFKENCKSCHKIHEESVGPALHGVIDRRPRKWLYAFIRNSQDLVKKKDTMAVNIYRKYQKAEMTSFPNLTEAEIDSILIYIGK